MEILGVIGTTAIFLIICFSLLYLILWIVALVDILSNEFEGQNKLIWVLVVALTGLVGAIIYFIIGTKQKINPRRN